MGIPLSISDLTVFQLESTVSDVKCMYPHREFGSLEYISGVPMSQ